MKLETFFEKFDRFADAPDAVAKMRGLLIHFAVSGKLAPNDPRERPVAISLSGPAADEVGLPSNWRCGLLGDAFTFEYGDNLPAPKRTETGEFPVYGSNGIVGTHDTCLTKEPAIIVGRKGSAGALNIADGPSWTTDVAYFVRPPKDLDLRFTYYLFSTLHLDELGKGIKPGLSRKEAYALPIALPPLAEQKRIVAKVEELMALCDRLEAQQQERDKQGSALARASLARFAGAPTPANLHFLFHPSYAIPPADLRKSILTLAVQGKLVPQDPNDEPAEQLLTIIRGDLHAQKKGAKADPFPIAEDELPHEVPFGWCWSYVQELAQPNQSVTYGILKPVWVNSGVPTVRVTEMKTGVIDVGSLPKCDPQRAAKFSKTTLHEGDLLVSKDGTIGKTAFVPRELAGGNITQHMLRFAISKRLDRDFIRLCVDAPPCQAWMVGETKGVALQGVNVGDFRRMPLPLPPLAEQRRIVAKVEQLMALVGRLEAQLATSHSSASKLLEAFVAGLTSIQPIRSSPDSIITTQTV